VVTEKIHNPDLDPLGTTHFLTLCGPCLGHDPYFGNHCFSIINSLLYADEAGSGSNGKIVPQRTFAAGGKIDAIPK